MDLFAYDRNQFAELLCGVDEAGRGPLAGDVYAAAVILPPDCMIEGLNDSKKLTAKKRDALYEEIVNKAVSYCIATATVEEIEQINILNATFLAMGRAVAGLAQTPSLVLVDGNRDPKINLPTKCIVKGDASSASIAAASILAKVSRDRYMEQVAEIYPDYQFGKHKGYGTELHYQMLDLYGESPVHRHSFLKKYYAARGIDAAKPVAPQQHQIGKLGEQLTMKYLADHGCEVVECNYHSPYGEIDVVAKTATHLLFVEVKTRTENGKYPAKSAVTKTKQQRLWKTALQYLQECQLELQPRFDVAEVYLSAEGKAYIHYIKAAFETEAE